MRMWSEYIDGVSRRRRYIDYANCLLMIPVLIGYWCQALMVMALFRWCHRVEPV
jgi:hypothetical protein